MGKIIEGVRRQHLRFTHLGDEAMLEKLKKLFSNFELFPLVLGCVENANCIHAHITYDSRRSLENVRERVLKLFPEIKGTKKYALKYATNVDMTDPLLCSSFRYLCKGYVKNKELPVIFINSDPSLLTPEFIRRTYEDLKEQYGKIDLVKLTVGEIADMCLTVKKERKPPANFMRDLCLESRDWFIIASKHTTNEVADDIYEVEDKIIYQNHFTWDSVEPRHISMVYTKVYTRFGELSKILDAGILARFINGLYCYHSGAGMKKHIKDRVFLSLGFPVNSEYLN